MCKGYCYCLLCVQVSSVGEKGVGEEPVQVLLAGKEPVQVLPADKKSAAEAAFEGDWYRNPDSYRFVKSGYL